MFFYRLAPLFYRLAPLCLISLWLNIVFHTAIQIYKILMKLSPSYLHTTFKSAISVIPYRAQFTSLVCACHLLKLWKAKPLLWHDYLEQPEVKSLNIAINPHQGLYAYNLMSYWSVPQMKTITSISFSKCFTRLTTHGFRLKLEKCEFLLKSIEYLRHVVTKDGIEPVPSKVEAIVKSHNLDHFRA